MDGVTEKRCRSPRTHKPHLWSRTTKRTVASVTPGDTFSCPGSASLALRAENDPRGAQIAAQARSGTNWAERVGYGPACVCGAFLNGTTVTSQGRLVAKPWCHRHGRYAPSRNAKER